MIPYYIMAIIAVCIITIVVVSRTSKTSKSDRSSGVVRSSKQIYDETGYRATRKQDAVLKGITHEQIREGYQKALQVEGPQKAVFYVRMLYSAGVSIPDDLAHLVEGWDPMGRN